MGIVIFNLVGIVIVAASFCAAFLLGKAFGFAGEGPLMIISASLIVAADLLYRLRFGKSQWFDAGHGGMLFFLPVWLFGALWFVLGILYTLGVAE